MNLPTTFVKTKKSWSFAAAPATIGEVQSALKTSYSVEVERGNGDKEQMHAAAKSMARLVESGLWGSGPFSLALSGTENSFFLSVVAR